MATFKASFTALALLFYVSNASPLVRSIHSVSFLESEETFTSTTIATPPVDSYYPDIEEPLDGEHSPENIEGGRPLGQPHHPEDAHGLDQIDEAINEPDHLQSREGTGSGSVEDVEQANMIDGKQDQSKLSNESQGDDQSVTGYHENQEEEAENSEVENSERGPEEPGNFSQSDELFDSLQQSNEGPVHPNSPEILPIAEPENSGETDSSSVDSQNPEFTNDVAEDVSESADSAEPVAVADNTEEGENAAEGSHVFPAETNDENPLVSSSAQSSAQLFGDGAYGMGMTHNVLNIDQTAGKDANIEIMYSNKNL